MTEAEKKLQEQVVSLCRWMSSVESDLSDMSRDPSLPVTAKIAIKSLKDRLAKIRESEGKSLRD